MTAGGGCIVVAGSGDEYSYSEKGHPAGVSDRWVVYLIKYDSQGNKKWEKVVTGLDIWNEHEYWAGEDIVTTVDGWFVVAVDNRQWWIWFCKI